MRCIRVMENKKMKKTIALVIPYFGKFHNYFSIFLKSCAYNQTVDFFVFTDIVENYDYPPNVHRVIMSFTALKERIQKLYDFEIVLNEPYDLCDFKVAYGEIFQEYLEPYDFWGFCDCDLIYGDIRHFLTEELLEKYEKLFMRGHFTLFRNVAEVNQLYRNEIDGVKQYEVAFSEAGAHHFDEGYPEDVPGINRIFQDAGIAVFDEYYFADIDVEHYAFRQSDLKDTEQEQRKEKQSVFAWEQGKLYRYYSENNVIRKEEFMYIHLQKRKMKNLISNVKQAEQFLVMPNRFTDYVNINAGNIKRFNRNRIYISRIYLRVKTGIARRISFGGKNAK